MDDDRIEVDKLVVIHSKDQRVTIKPQPDGLDSIEIETLEEKSAPTNSIFLSRSEARELLKSLPTVLDHMDEVHGT